MTSTHSVLMPLSRLVAENASFALDGNQLALGPVCRYRRLRASGRKHYFAATTVVVASAGRLASSACSVLMVE